MAGLSPAAPWPSEQSWGGMRSWEARVGSYTGLGPGGVPTKPMTVGELDPRILLGGGGLQAALRICILLL